jgi:hypothetical protein
MNTHGNFALRNHNGSVLAANGDGGDTRAADGLEGILWDNSQRQLTQPVTELVMRGAA